MKYLRHVNLKNSDDAQLSYKIEQIKKHTITANNDEEVINILSRFPKSQELINIYNKYIKE